MSTTAVQGQVVAVNGVAKAIDAQGHERILKAGDIILPGERVVLLDGATLSVARADGELLNVDGPREMALTTETMQPQTTDKTEAAVAKLAPEAQQVLAALENGQDPLAQLDPAAAGLNGAGGADEGSHGFVRLMRVSEALGGALGDGAGGAAFNLPTEQNQASSNTAVPVNVSIDNISATNDATPTIHGTGIPGLTVIVTNTSGAVIGSAVVGSDGNWFITPTSPLPDGTDTLIATSTNTAGVTATATATAIIDTTPPATPTVTISEHGTPDGVINASELVNGKVEATVKLDAADLAKNGSATIVVNDGGHTTTLVVHADGSVTGGDANVSASYSNGTVTLDIVKPADGSTVTVTASQTDAVGNHSGTGTDEATLHATLPTATITVDNVTADNILNIREFSGDMVTITGTVGGDAKLGDKVTLDIGGAHYETTVIDINGQLGFSKVVGTGDLSSATNIHATVSVSDSYNNTATASTDHAYSVDLKAPTIAIDATLAGDNVVNEAEQKQPLTISGTTSGVEDGQTVDVQFNGEHYTANVSNNHWTLDVPAAHLSNLADGQTYTITANVHDLAGNSAAPAKHDLGVHVTAPEATITVDNVTADNILNINEFYGDVVTITGTVGGDAKLDDKVTLDIGGAHYETTVIDINGQLGFSVDVGTGDLSGATKIHATVSVSDSYNNTATASTDHDYLVDLTSPKASITVDPVTADNVLNIQETSGSTVTVTGTVGGDVKVGDTVMLTVNGQNAYGNVLDLGNGKLGYSIAVSSDDLKNDSNIHASVTTSSIGGNSGDASTNHSYGLDLQAPTISIDSGLAGDDIVNAAEHKLPLTISGSTSAEDGQTVDVVLNGQHYSATVSNGSWSTEVPATDVAKLADGSSYTITADVRDKAGNPAVEASHKLSVDASATITILDDGSGGDHIFNQTEAGTVNVTGTTSGVEPGQAVYVTFTDGTNSVTSIVLVQKDGSWSTSGDLTLDLTSLEQGKINVTASVVDKAGNTASDSVNNDVLDTQATITIASDGSGKDGVFNKTEAAAAAVSGSTTGVEAGQTVTVTFTDSQNHVVSVNTKVGANGSWTVPAQSLSGLVDGSVTVKAAVSDVAGNTATDSHSDSLDTKATITIASDGSGKDGVFNKTEAAAAAVSGSTTGVEAGQTVTVTFTDSQNHVVSVDTKVGANGSWTVPAQNLSTLVDGAVTVKAQVSDLAGNTATDSHKDGLDTLATIKITNDGSGGDHIFNQTEAGTVNVTGTTSGVEPGQAVYVTFTDGANSVSSIVYVQKDGSWSTSGDLTLDLTSLEQGKISVTASVVDKAGNTASDSVNNDVLDTQATITIASDGSGKDGVFNKTEAAAAVVSGSTTGVEAGQTVTVTFTDSQNHVVSVDTKVGANGSWTVPAQSLSGLVDGTVTVKAAVSDVAGNKATDSHNDSLATTAPDAPKVSFVASGTYSYSNYFGIDDAHISTPVSGQNALSTVLGDLVNLNPTATFIAQSINFGTSSGAWQDSSLAVKSNLGSSGALQDFITNSHGSTGTDLQLAGNYGTTSRAIVETGGVFTAAAGNYTIAVRADDGYLLMIDGKVVAQEVDNQSPATAWYTVHLDATANNQHTMQIVYWDQGGLATLQVSLEQNGNNIVNLLQPDSTVTAQVTLNANDQAVLVNGGSVHLTGSGNTDLTLHLENGKLVDGSHNSYGYQNGVISLSMAAPAAGASIALAATVSDKSGNISPSASASYSQPVIPTGHLQHDAVNDTGSNSADSITADKTPVITGTADANSQITVTLNGHSYTTSADNTGHWSVSVSDALPDGVYIPLVKAVDANGATATGFGTAFAVDGTATITIASDGSGSDGVFNKSEAAAAAVSGTTSGVEAGQTVTVTFTDSANHVVTTTTKVGSDGSWSVSPASLSNLSDGKVTVKAQVSDVAGNTATDSHKDGLDTQATIKISNDGSGGDHIFNQTEAGTVNVTGTTSGVEPGQAVYVTFTDGANSVSSIVYVQKDGSWSTSGDLKLDLTSLEQGKINVTASVVDKAGNTASDSVNNDILDTQAPLAAQLSSTTTTTAITGLFNTGLDANGHAVAAGQVDANYKLVSKPADASLSGTTVVSETDAGGKHWVTNDYSNSQWIGDMSDSYGRYTYQTTFTIASTADLATVLISFDLSADDNVHILVNGKDTGLSYNSLWTQIQHVDLSNDSGVGSLFVVGNNTLTFEVDNSGGGATGLKVDNMVATVQGQSLELDVSLAGTGAVANDTLTITAVEHGVTTSTTHVLTSNDISNGIVSQSQHQPDAHTVSTYTATLTDKAGNVSTVATETVFGSGNHTVSDGVGVDTFKWTLASNGSSTAAATTTISNFDLADHASGGSALDLKDLLQGENHTSGIGNLTSYLHFTQSGSDTTVHVSASGSFANTTAGDTVDIVLKGVSLADLGGGLGHTSDTQIIQNLLNHGKLITD